MVEKEISKEKEAEVPQINYYEANYKYVNDRTKRMAQGRRVIKGSKMPWEQGRQGLVRWYLNDLIPDTANDRWTMFVHEIRMHSGKHAHQGGLTIFVLAGKGYTTVDGVRFDWSTGDLICLPIKKGGVEHQHFNLDGKPSRWLALINNRIIEFAGRFIEQREESPDWVKMQKKK